MKTKRELPDPRLALLLKETQEKNPELTFVMSESVIYWRCDDGFEYGIFALAFRRRCDDDPPDAPTTEIVKVWDGQTSYFFREWAGFDKVALMRWEDDGGPAEALPDENPWRSCYTIYFNPSDYPGKFVTRRHWTNRIVDIADTHCVVSETLEQAREPIPAGLINMGRYYEVDPAIYEVWL